MLLLLNQEKLQSPRTNHHVQQSVKDPLLTAKLNFFLMIAKEIQPFLTKNQADKPLLPFFATDMQRFITPDVLSNAKLVVKLLNIEFPNHVDLSKVNIGFAAERILRDLKGSNKLSEKQVFEFRMSLQGFSHKDGQETCRQIPFDLPSCKVHEFPGSQNFYCKERNIC